MKPTLLKAVHQALEQAVNTGELPGEALNEKFAIEEPKTKTHGDLATNAAMQLARPCRKNPRAIAEILAKHLGDGGGILSKVEIAGPGFINFFLSQKARFMVLAMILEKGTDFGRCNVGEGRRVMVEFVSANPTGPLHVGHGRGAALGDALARLLSFTGYDCAAEYYINDAGNQMNTLGRSVLVRARQLKGSNEEFPENHYRGEYIKDVAARLLETAEGEGLLDKPAEEAAAIAGHYAEQDILAGIKRDLADFQVSFDKWFSERSLMEKGAVDKAFDRLKEMGRLFDEDGALWFKATDLGDEKNRVVKRSNGETTYFASDIAYHLNKFDRGFDWAIDVWGADHHGYIPRMKAAIQALGRKPDDLEIVLVQLVNLLRGGKPVAMSTRAGEFVTLKDVVDEVGSDSARFIFLTRRSDSPLDFDLDLAKEKSMDNPVYYVQYAHTRVKSIERKAAEQGFVPADADKIDLSLLTLPQELELDRILNRFPEVVEAAALALEPHRITYYLQELAQAFHSYYNADRVLVDDENTAQARLMLARAVGQVLKNGLSLLGVSAPESM